MLAVQKQDESSDTIETYFRGLDEKHLAEQATSVTNEFQKLMRDQILTEGRIELLCEELAVRAEEIYILNNLDGSILKILCGPDSPVGWDETRVADHWKLVELLDDAQRNGSFRLLFSFMILNHPVGS